MGGTLWQEAKGVLCTIGLRFIRSASLQTAHKLPSWQQGALPLLATGGSATSCGLAATQNVPCAKHPARLLLKPFQGHFWQHSSWAIPCRRAQKPHLSLQRCVT